ncbi:MAG: amidohydrolase family protein, partial [Chromatocurvus sp.]
ALLAEGPHADPCGMLTVKSVKISSDGALGSRGAALEADYTDQPGHRGLLLLEEEVLAATMRRAAAAGFQVNTHAIGDRANRLVLDVLAQMRAESGDSGLRHRVEHAQILRPQDLQRFAALDVIASIQPTHATSDMNMAADRLGEARLEAAYAWQSLLESGARLAGGSDFPVEHPNPFHGLYSAVTRQDQAGEPPGGWLPAQKMTREAALALFTEGAAFAGHDEDRLGRLRPGYAADFILVRDDYFEVPEADIWKNRVLSTWVAGEKVYDAGD